MQLLFTLFFFLFGITFGSFYNVVGLRSPKNEPFVNDRSYCPSCKHQLSWYELIPVFSFLLQTGKCRHCKTKISFTYPSIELLTGFLFAFSFWKIGFDWELITALFLVSMLMIILVSDITYMVIQNKILLFFLPLITVMRVIQPLDPWWSPIVGAIVIAVILAIIILVSRGGMGAGDMKLFAVLGIVLGVEKVLLAFFLSCLLGAIIGMLLILFKVIKRKQPVPFGPYIVLAALIAYFYGEMLIDWYLRLII
ncbi:prepilin peptidase [Oceanobacillus chungangensis]|uniref:Prepilin peptidase n=1 Tax=Oceanobacillus chungangensis TaxID=1229152 RepID=A0A3D8Q019_9BACI|nr:A24 family peptidase [Oceanobacillus chungangensis]RDW21790.1 prepilin peptidase [Oceanobacillus chungangensis]